ncbi:hypothetical protein [Kitasatospora sp. MMS16-BH015]|uniref:hypothetical protein n=1 Tax=Kitasatospora sp. MMS16-BH015 TaxID=2018025 RepID=UPI00131A5F56|nr:hypothetical protein [Kitasatospora sp. MMS16-BH015]
MPVGLKGLVVFGVHWRPRFVRFDPTSLRLVSRWTLRRLVERELRPVLAPLAALPRRRPSRIPVVQDDDPSE